MSQLRGFALQVSAPLYFLRLKVSRISHYHVVTNQQKTPHIGGFYFYRGGHEGITLVYRIYKFLDVKYWAS